MKINSRLLRRFFLAGIALILSASVHANYADRADVKKFITSFAKESDYTSDELRQLFKNVKKQTKVLESLANPAESVLEWYQYRKIFLKPDRISRGVAFWQKHQQTLEEAEKKYGVPAEIIVAIIGVETYYGKHTGRWPVLDSLVTIAFDFPKRAKFFTSELKHYLILSKEQGWDHSKIKGSYAGAMGLGQFISSSYRHYAVDNNSDGKIDLFDPVDAIGSVANYFSRHGWKQGQNIVEPLHVKSVPENMYSNKARKPKLTAEQLKKVGVALINRQYEGKYAIIPLKKDKQTTKFWLGYHNFYVITRYNHSNMYAMAAYQLSQNIKSRMKVQ